MNLKQTLSTVGVALFLGTSFVVGAYVIAPMNATPASEVATVTETRNFGDSPEKVIATPAPAVAPVEVPAPVVEVPVYVEEPVYVEPTGPTLCPSGTDPNYVDEYGNESGCSADSASGEQCNAYDANNVCISYYKP